MSDPQHDSHRDPQLGERMERVVGGLRAPDVVDSAMAKGRRQRARRGLAYAAGGVAAVTALAVTVPALAGELSTGQDPSAPPVAADPTPSGTPTPLSEATDQGTPKAEETCDPAATGFWSKPNEQVEAELAALLPDGVTIDSTEKAWPGWSGNLRAGDDLDFASIELLPPPGVRGGWITIEQLQEGGPCAGGANEPKQRVIECSEIAGVESCEEIRSESGDLTGVVVEKLQEDVVDGQDVPTDLTYVTATIAVPGGGHVELYVGEGTRQDRPSTVHDPADVPALTPEQARAIVTDPVWTS